jgi:hypothetical protein
MVSIVQNFDVVGITRCVACNSIFEPCGWTNLCNRGCYYTMCGLLNEYETYKVNVPDARVVEYFTRNPDGGGHSFSPVRIFEYIAHLNHVEETHTCIACRSSFEPSGWMDLCNRRCYYAMCDLLYDYETCKVDVPDARVVEYFTRNPDGGGHSFSPERVFTFIASQR